MASTDHRFTSLSRWKDWDRKHHFTLDPCGHPKAPVSLFMEARGDLVVHKKGGLDVGWSGHRVWCNPPYSDIEPWVQAALQRRAVTLMLVPAWTDRAWWQRYVEPNRARPWAAAPSWGKGRWVIDVEFTTRFSFGTPRRPDIDKSSAWRTQLQYGMALLTFDPGGQLW